MTASVLEVRGLVKHYPLAGGLFGAPKVVRAVDGVSFELRKGESSRSSGSRAAASPPSRAASSA